MRVIYVHGVSERPNQSGYAERLARRQDLFEEFVAEPLGEPLSLFGDAPWGHLRPTVNVRASRGRTSIQTFGDEIEEVLFDQLRKTDFRTDGDQLDAAGYLDSVLMITQTLSDNEKKAVQRAVWHLASTKTTIEFGDTDERPANVVRRIATTIVASPQPSSQRFDRDWTDDWKVRLLDSVTTLTIKGMSLRDVVARELGVRWADALWYVAAGRSAVQKAVLEKFDTLTRGIVNEPVVVLGHSFGALVSFEVINSDRFLEMKLHERGRWALLCLGAQIPVFRQLEVTPREIFRGELHGKANLRNLLDINDPLAFSLGDDAIDLRFMSGAGIVLSHSAYLDSPVALENVFQALRSITYDWKRSTG